MPIFSVYIKEIYGFTGGKIILNLFLMVLLGALEGIGILLLIPLLHFAGIGGASQANIGTAFIVGDILRSMSPGTLLPLVLLTYVGLVFMQSGLQRYQSNLSVRIQQSWHSHLSIRIFRGLAYAKWSFLAGKKKSDLITVFTSELTRVSSGTHYFLQLTATAILALIQILIAFWISPALTVIVIAGGLIFYILTEKHVKRAKEMGLSLSRHSRNLYSSITEHINGIKEVKSCGMEETHISKFKEIRRALESNFEDFNRVQTGTQMFYKVGAAIFISIFFYMMICILRIPPQEILLIVVIFGRLWPKFSAFQGGLQNVAMMLPAFYDVLELERRCLEEAEKYPSGQSIGKSGLTKRIEFRNVFFSYDPLSLIYAVKDLSFDIFSGSTTALVGVSGAGKSTVADLITGMLTPQRGQILIDGVPIDCIDIHLWRKSIAYVSQDTFLFNASIRDNMLFANQEAKEEELWQALKVSAIDDFVAGLPAGLDTAVGDRGMRLSGGERQRIVLARSLLRKPSVLILDEATGALDQENESRILKSIGDLQDKPTVLLIAHRFSTIKDADRIIIMDDGNAAEIGDYHSLINKPESRLRSLMTV